MYVIGSTFARKIDIAYDTFNKRDLEGKMPKDSSNCIDGNNNMPFKDFKKNKPIEGYKGFVQGKKLRNL